MEVESDGESENVDCEDVRVDRGECEGVVEVESDGESENVDSEGVRVD